MNPADPPVPPGVDVTQASISRMYDYVLGGTTNYEVDRAAVEQVAAMAPELWEIAKENRAFLHRAVRFMAGQGIEQFIDIGSGLPTAGNTHEIAQQVTPDARVVYVDKDPSVLAHGRELLTREPGTALVSSDLRAPDEILGHPETLRLIDFGRPTGVLLFAVTHYLTDDEYPAIMERLFGALPAGSMVALTHITPEGHSPEVIAQTKAVLAAASSPLSFRTKPEIEAIFSGLEILEPGLVTLEAWRPDPADPTPPPAKWLYGGIATKHS